MRRLNPIERIIHSDDIHLRGYFFQNDGNFILAVTQRNLISRLSGILVQLILLTPHHNGA